MLAQLNYQLSNVYDKISINTSDFLWHILINCKPVSTCILRFTKNWSLIKRAMSLVSKQVN